MGYRTAIAMLGLSLALIGCETAGAVEREEDRTLWEIMWRFQDRPEEGVQRIRYAVEILGVDVNGGVRDGDHEDTPLCGAPTIEMAQELIRLGAVVRGRGDSSQTLLQCASYYGRDVRLFDWIIEELGEDINEIGRHGTALCMAAQDQDVDAVRFLLERGADPNLYNRRDRGTHPLACAMQNTRPWSEVELIIAALTEAGAVTPGGGAGRHALAPAATQRKSAPADGYLAGSALGGSGIVWDGNGAGCGAPTYDPLPNVKDISSGGVTYHIEVQFRLDGNGLVTDVDLVRGGNSELNSAVLTAARGMRFDCTAEARGRRTYEIKPGR